MATIKITQTGSPIRRTPDQRKTLIGLGFRLGRADAAATEQVGNLLAATLGHRARARLVLERFEGGADHVVGVRGADRLGHDVVNAQALEDGAHRAAGDDARTGRGRADIDPAGAKMTDAVMVQGAASQFKQR